uniref:Reverse transcriptase domain-containing protein n=1 Tax=Triticum urartu TaxID=4572 RepID=A0A8R7TSZ5_TRIUA
MPFGLTNAPATFQALMNKLFAPYLRKFVLVFFDDILIFSRTPEEHQQHLTLVLEILKANNLLLNRSKCNFGTTTVEYLGHILSAQGVATEPGKIEAVQQWSIPTN